MRLHLRHLVPLAGALLGASPLAAQTVWTVTAYEGIQAAVDAASPGDVVVLANNGGFPDYRGFTLTKGLTIRANGSRIGVRPQDSPNTITVAVPPGEVAHLVGLDLTYSYSPYGTTGSKVMVQSGRVAFEDCILSCYYVPPLTINAGQVTVVRGTVQALGYVSAPAIVATNAQLVLRDTTVVGSSATCQPPNCTPYPASPGVALTQSTLQAERTTFTGGSQNRTDSAGTGQPAILATNSVLRLSDCTLTAGSTNPGLGNGGTALVNNGTTPAALRQTQLIPGQPNGSASSGPIDPTAALVRLSVSGAWQRGVARTVTVLGDANAPYGLWFASDPVATTRPEVVEPLWLLTGPLLAFGLLDANGTATSTIAVPNDPILLHMVVWLQIVAGSQSPWHASTLAGGIIR